MSKYHVGDIVRVRPDLSKDMEFTAWDGLTLGVTSVMAELAGNLVTIDGITPYGYTVKESGECKYWVEDMFYDLVKPYLVFHL